MHDAWWLMPSLKLQLTRVLQRCILCCDITVVELFFTVCWCWTWTGSGLERDGQTCTNHEETGWGGLPLHIWHLRSNRSSSSRFCHSIWMSYTTEKETVKKSQCLYIYMLICICWPRWIVCFFNSSRTVQLTFVVYIIWPVMTTARIMYHWPLNIRGLLYISSRDQSLWRQ